jgi:DNA recombination protein RmuC
MEIATVLIALLALAAGACVGYVAGQRDGVRREAAVRAEMRDESTHRERAILQAAAEREQGLHRAASDRDRQLRDDLRRGDVERDARLKTELQAASQQAIAATSKQIFDMADARIKATEQVVAPVTTNLDKLADALHTLQTHQSSWQAELKEQVASVNLSGAEIRRQTQALSDALRKPQVRGQWGELQLKRSLELANLTSHVTFDEQVSLRGDDGVLRPDVVIGLPGGRRVVVDSKVPLDAFLSATAATDAQARDGHLARHAKHVRTHVDSLSSKAYWKQFERTPDFVVMFIPNEAMFSAALETDPALIEYASAKAVVLATPTTLIAMLKTVDYTWKQEAVASNARQVHEIGRELYERIGVVGSHLDRLGRSISSLVGTYNKTISSVESRMLVSARRMHELRVSDALPPEAVVVKETPTPLTAPELLDDDPPAAGGDATGLELIEGPPGREQWTRHAG